VTYNASFSQILKATRYAVKWDAATSQRG